MCQLREIVVELSIALYYCMCVKSFESVVDGYRMMSSVSIVIAITADTTSHSIASCACWQRVRCTHTSVVQHMQVSDSTCASIGTSACRNTSRWLEKSSFEQQLDSTRGKSIRTLLLTLVQYITGMSTSYVRRVGDEYFTRNGDDSDRARAM